MEAKTFESKYKLTDFNLYLRENIDRNETISVVDFVIESDNIDFIEKEFNNIFVINNDKIFYLFSDYKLEECYKIGDWLIRIICTK